MSKTYTKCVTEFIYFQQCFKWVLKKLCPLANKIVAEPFFLEEFGFYLPLVLRKSGNNFYLDLQKLHGRPFHYDTVLEKKPLIIESYVLDCFKRKRFSKTTQITSSSDEYEMLCILGNELNAEKEVIMPDLTLTIICDVKITKSHSSTMQLNTSLGASMRNLDYDFENFFKNKKFCDVIIKCNYGNEIEAHKILLAAQSDVFHAMFQHKMLENKNNFIEITDFDSHICKKMMNFIYTGEVPNLSKCVNELLAISDKYDLKKLRAMCRHELMNSTEVVDPVGTLFLADRYKNNALKQRVIKHFILTDKQLIKSKQFQQLCCENPDLLSEILLAAVE